LSFQWYRTENDVPAAEMSNATSSGTGRSGQNYRSDYTDKSDPVSVHMVYGMRNSMSYNSN